MNPTPPRYSTLPFPAYPFVPGETPHPHRDPRGHSYGSPVPSPPADWQPDEWTALTPYLHGVDLYNHGYWWEAHETWESLWHAAPPASAAADYLQGLIHVAAAALHRRRGNASGAEGQARKALTRLDEVGGRHPWFMGVAITPFAREVRETFLISRRDRLPVIVLEPARIQELRP